MDNPSTSPLAASSSVPKTAVLWNVPNQLTVARLVLSIVCFAFLVVDSYLVALVLFVLAAGTDWVDGYWARKYGQVTQLGRILDPFADKIIICGTFIFLAAVPPTIVGESATAIAAWMAVVVLGREMLVTAIRGFFEDQGVDFSAQRAGKWKMLFQCAAVAFCLWRLWYYGYDPNAQSWATEPGRYGWSTWSVWILVWVAVLMTVYSGWGYIQTALRMLKR
jgi:CDP-diacylglycerol---glycerol-3-phosphate 3-phosphatidyltransferase